MNLLKLIVSEGLITTILNSGHVILCDLLLPYLTHYFLYLTFQALHSLTVPFFNLLSLITSFPQLFLELLDPFPKTLLL